MNKTINVNIGGVAFIIDEDAHLMLSNYLHQIENRLSPMERREIMEDVENRIADIFSQHVSIRSQVVNSFMVRSAINTIGNAEDFGEAQSYESTTKESKKEQPKVTLGFNRSRTDKKFGGICGGLSTLTGIDSTILRLIMVILMISSFSVFFWAYIIVWIIVPEEPITTKDEQNERR